MNSLRTSSDQWRVISVMIGPGATALTRIPLGPYCRASVRVRPITPALLVA